LFLNNCRIPDIEGLYVLGNPEMTVVAFASKEVNIYKVNEAMAEKGWSLNALHKPSRYILSVFGIL
jgi:sphinganine-1-phosphate aldolase